jgi:hypothetical protein
MVDLRARRVGGVENGESRFRPVVERLKKCRNPRIEEWMVRL